MGWNAFVSLECSNANDFEFRTTYFIKQTPTHTLFHCTSGLLVGVQFGFPKTGCNSSNNAIGIKIYCSVQADQEPYAKTWEKRFFDEDELTWGDRKICPFRKSIVQLIFATNSSAPLYSIKCLHNHNYLGSDNAYLKKTNRDGNLAGVSKLFKSFDENNRQTTRGKIKNGKSCDTKNKKVIRKNRQTNKATNRGVNLKKRNSKISLFCSDIDYGTEIVLTQYLTILQSKERAGVGGISIIRFELRFSYLKLFLICILIFH